MKKIVFGTLASLSFPLYGNNDMSLMVNPQDCSHQNMSDIILHEKENIDKKDSNDMSLDGITSAILDSRINENNSDNQDWELGIEWDKSI